MLRTHVYAPRVAAIRIRNLGPEDETIFGNPPGRTLGRSEEAGAKARLISLPFANMGGDNDPRRGCSGLHRMRRCGRGRYG